jgi:hypothetical protein
MNKTYILSIFLLSILIYSCTNENVGPDEENSPPDVEYTVASPCVSADENCNESIAITSEEGRSAVFTFFNNYPILNDTAVWGNIKQAVFVVHGQNRDANNYFSYMTASLNSSDLLDSTLLIAPHFKNNSQVAPGQLFWPSDWRSGALSGNPSLKISSFSLLDTLINIISDKEHFPFLEKILITGHSSGGLFCHSYALASKADREHDAQFFYVIANSQYFYYPIDQRYDPNTESFKTPTTCEEFDEWPYGFVSPVEYLADEDRDELNNAFIKKKITYLLGTDDTETSGSLNTSNCAAVLLGEHRYNRGENMYLHMNTFYQNEHNHSKKLVLNIGHNGNRMYNSNSFKELLQDIL